MDSHRLADSFVDWVVDVELFQSVVAGVEHAKDADDAVMVDFVVAQVEREQFVMREKQLSDHHGSIGLDLVSVQVQILQTRALLQRFSQVLRPLTFYLVALKIQAKKSF